MILETTSGGSVSNAVVQYFGYDQSTNNVSGAYTVTDIAAGTYRLTAYGWNEDYNTSLAGSSVQLTI
jgi:hypothetical protein